MPRSALASWPLMFHDTVVGELSFSCSKVTVPLTLESPRRTATTLLVSFAHARPRYSSGSPVEAGVEKGGPSWPSWSPVAGHSLDVPPGALHSERSGTLGRVPAWSSRRPASLIEDARLVRYPRAWCCAYKTCSIPLGELGRVPRLANRSHAVPIYKYKGTPGGGNVPALTILTICMDQMDWYGRNVRGVNWCWGGSRGEGERRLVSFGFSSGGAACVTYLSGRFSALSSESRPSN